MVKHEMGKDLEKDVHLIYCIIAQYFDSFPRCHESARIFCNVLKRYCYKVEVVNGFYSSPHFHDGEELLHSWVEVFNTYPIYRTRKIIEASPHQVFPELSPEEQTRSLVISRNDKKFGRYRYIPDSMFLEYCKKRRVQIDTNLIELRSKFILQCLKKIHEEKVG